MSAARRKDIHAPSTFNPADYDFLDTIYQGANVTDLGEAFVQWSRQRVKVLRAGLEKDNKFKGNWLLRSTCDHCGAHFDYGMVYIHADGDRVVVGQQCAENAFSFGTRATYEAARLRARVAGAREKQKKVGRAETFLAQHPGLREALDLREKHEILADMNAKLYNWGSLSEKQIAFALKLAEEIRNPPPPKPEEPKVKIVEGRRDIRGTVLAVKTQEGPYGTVRKMLVRTEDGQKLWGTIPSSLRTTTEAVTNVDGTPMLHDDGTPVTQTVAAELARGTVVEFTATVKASDNDEFFGIFSRPTGGAIISTTT